MAIRISDDFIAELHRIGLVPDCSQVRRVVIDLECGEVPVMHIEKLVDDSAIQLIRSLDGIEIGRVEKGSEPD